MLTAKCEMWEDEDRIITVTGLGPCGMTTNERDGRIIVNWLNDRCGLTALHDFFRAETVQEYYVPADDLEWLERFIRGAKMLYGLDVIGSTQMMQDAGRAERILAVLRRGI